MSALLVIIATVLASLVTALVRGVVVDELKRWLQMRATRRLERAIDQLPEDVREEWADSWRAQFATLMSLPLTALRFELAVRRMPGTLRSAEMSLERTIAALSPELRDEWADEWRAELASIAEDPLTAARWARGIRRSARALTTPGLDRVMPDWRIRVPRWARKPSASSAAPIRTSARSRSKGTRSIRYRVLLTATLCLLVIGAVMVYAASNPRVMPGSESDGTDYLLKYISYGAIGVLAMHLAARMPLDRLRQATPILLGLAFFLCMLVKVPAVGVEVNGATRWVGVGPVQFQPSELMKLALVLYAVHLLAQRPGIVQSVRDLASPLLLVVGAAAISIASQPDLGTALVISFTMAALLIAAGTPVRILAILGGSAVGSILLFALAAPYRRARLTSFLDPSSHADGAGYQVVQSQLAIGSGGWFGQGLGDSHVVVPEGRTEFILAVIGEQLGVVGVVALLALYALIAYAGLRISINAHGAYPQLLAAGLTSLILCQALLNVFTVLGLAPLTGVPLPFVSSGSSSLLVLLLSVGLVMNVASVSARRRVSAARRPARQPPPHQPIASQL